MVNVKVSAVKKSKNIVTVPIQIKFVSVGLLRKINNVLISVMRVTGTYSKETQLLKRKILLAVNQTMPNIQLSLLIKYDVTSIKSKTIVNANANIPLMLSTVNNGYHNTLYPCQYCTYSFTVSSPSK